jgi:hypothetical protein
MNEIEIVSSVKSLRRRLISRSMKRFANGQGHSAPQNPLQVHRFLWIVFATALAILFNYPVMALDGALPIRNLSKGSFSGIDEAKQEVLKDQATWEKWWSRHSVGSKPAEKLPNVDFEKEIVVAITMGRQRTGGYAVEILDARESNKRLQIKVKKTMPKPGGMAIQALTSPFHYVAIPKSGLKPEFLEDLQDAGSLPKKETKP